VDANHLSKAAELVPEARRYTDWREMLAKEGDQIDSVNATVPDHMHLPIALAAMRAGKHVYCQKPLCHDVAECRLLAETARQTGVVTQLGTQFASGAGDRMAVQWLREGVIGTVKNIILCSNRPGAIDDYRLVGPRRPRRAAAGASGVGSLAGTAPAREYSPNIYHPVKCAPGRISAPAGPATSAAISSSGLERVGTGRDRPLTVTAEVQESWKNDAARRRDVWPQSDHVTWTFPGNRYTAARLHHGVFDGLIYPPAECCHGERGRVRRYPPRSAMIIGTEGALLLPHTSGPVLLPKAASRDNRSPTGRAQPLPFHFLDACRAARCANRTSKVGPMAETICSARSRSACPTPAAVGRQTDACHETPQTRTAYAARVPAGW
jgi:predicted dehydrogenase